MATEQIRMGMRGGGRKMAFDVMEDCIHLKACRRVQAIGRKYRLNVPRYCTEDCTAYQSGDEGSYLPIKEAVAYARRNYDGRSDPYDVYAECDLQGMTLNEILEDVE